jgi:hypothetical protein
MIGTTRGGGTPASPFGHRQMAEIASATVSPNASISLVAKNIDVEKIAAAILAIPRAIRVREEHGVGSSSHV